MEGRQNQMIRKVAIQIGFFILLAFVLMNAYLAVNHLKQVQKIAAVTAESSAFQAKLSVVLKDVVDMETGQRGYLLTDDSAYLQPYTDAKNRITPDLAALRPLFANRAQSEQSLESQLESLAQSKQDEMERTISLRQQGYRRRSFNLVDSNEGKGYMDEIRRIVSSLSSAENSNLARFEAGTTAAVKRIWSITIMANSGLFLLAALLFWLVQRYGRLLGEEASQSRTQLASRDSRLETLTSALSGQVRSSITAINTNSQLLLEEYGSFLPRHGHELAVQVKDAALEMEQIRQNLVDKQHAEKAA
jgi:CHASE3 domain sensor protein